MDSFFEGKLMPNLPDNLTLESLRDYVTTHKRQVDLAWHLLIYLPLLLNTKGLMRHFAGPKLAKAQKFPYIPLITHIILGLILVARYQFRALTSTSPPQPDIFDIASGVINAILSFRLSKYEGRGNPNFARAGFQSAAVMLLFASCMCYFNPDAGSAWYHALVKMHNAFIYVRWLGKYGNQLKIYSSGHESYNVAVWFGGCLGVMEACFPWEGVLGVPLYLGVQVALVVVERRVSGIITVENSKTNLFLRLMLAIGLVEIGTYKALKEPVVADGHSEKPAETKSEG